MWAGSGPHDHSSSAVMTMMAALSLLTDDITETDPGQANVLDAEARAGLAARRLLRLVGQSVATPSGPRLHPACRGH